MYKIHVNDYEAFYQQHPTFKKRFCCKFCNYEVCNKTSIKNHIYKNHRNYINEYKKIKYQFNPFKKDMYIENERE